MYLIQILALQLNQFSFITSLDIANVKWRTSFEALEQQLEMFIENTRQMGIIVSDFQPQGQNVLNQKM